MGKTSQRRATQIQENNVGCTWGLIRMFYSRRDPKLILDRKQGSTRHSFSGFPGTASCVWVCTELPSFSPLDATETLFKLFYCCSNIYAACRNLFPGDNSCFGLVFLRTRRNAVPRNQLGHDVCLDKRTTPNSKPKGVTDPSADIGIASSSECLDPSGSKCMEQVEEDGLELALSDFPELESIIHTKLNEYNNPPCDLAYEKTPVSEEKQISNQVEFKLQNTVQLNVQHFQLRKSGEDSES
uniref:Uncharacterized protein n=1 Tax=Aegilops tauschii subsp. strangulata TaxID=200361 RepID=A0A453J8X7_AEGTS